MDTRGTSVDLWTFNSSRDALRTLGAAGRFLEARALGRQAKLCIWPGGSLEVLAVEEVASALDGLDGQFHGIEFAAPLADVGEGHLDATFDLSPNSSLWKRVESPLVDGDLMGIRTWDESRQSSPALRSGWNLPTGEPSDGERTSY